jgi:hypothetical protein
LKKRLASEEKAGLEQNYVKVAESYLKIHGNTPLTDVEAAPLLEAFLVGYSLEEIHQKYQHIDLGKLCLTASTQLWHKKRQEVASSIYDRVRTKLVRSVVEQVEYMTDLLSVASTESKQTIANYLRDPASNPPPANRIRSIKEYKDAIDSLTKLTDHIVKITAPRDEVRAEKAVVVKKLKVDSKYSSKEASLLAELVDTGDDE